MSFVNKVSKNNTIYNIQDNRVYVVDLGNVDNLIEDNRFVTTITGTDLLGLYNAEEGIIKFTYEGTEAVCKVFGKGEESGNYHLMASLFMQMESSAYTTFMVSVSGTSSTAQVVCDMINVSIGGGSGGGATIIEKEIIDEQDGMLIFNATSSDYDALNNNDQVILKLTMEDGDIAFYLYKQMSLGGDGSDSGSYCFGFDPDGNVGMSTIMAQDGSYMGIAFFQSIRATTLYAHEVNLSGFVLNGVSITAILELIGAESNTYGSVSSIESDYKYNRITSMVLRLEMDIEEGGETIHQIATTPVLGIASVDGIEPQSLLVYFVDSSIATYDLNDLSVINDNVNPFNT